MPVFSVTAETCIACGLCGAVCPSSIIAAVKGKKPRMRKDREEDCIGCGHCVVTCPTGAAHIDCLPEDQILPVEKTLLPSAESVDMFCKSRRSVRRYAAKPVSKEELKAILDVARYAPSAKNVQPLRWVAIYERTRMKQLGDMVAEYFEQLSKAPVGSIPVKSLKLLTKAWRAGDDPIFRGAPHLVLAVSPKADVWEGVDAAIALTYLELAAKGRNVGCCWAGYVTRAARGYAPIQEFLGIGPEEIVSGGQMLGYAAATPRAVPPRKPLNLEWL